MPPEFPKDPRSELQAMTPGSEEVVLPGLSQALLDGLPGWGVLIRAEDRTVLFANHKARQAGAQVGGRCWEGLMGGRFVPSQGGRALPEASYSPKCYFCQGDQCLEQDRLLKSTLDLDSQDLEVRWVPVSPGVFLHYALDVTEQRAAVETRRRAAMLEAVLQTADSAFHELTQPLQVLTAKLDMMMMSFEGQPGQVRKLETLQEQLDRITSITHRLSRIIRVDSRTDLSPAQGETLPGALPILRPLSGR
jgi:signal transduction histidine kinase